MPNLVIAALPSKDDYVNKISSEKVAHMTILFLGEVNKIQNLVKIIDFTKHASDQILTRFSMDVDRRGVLGPDLADVLFFKKTKFSGFEDINNFRSNLLKENNIRTAFNSTKQFSEWQPHLTLGYPTSPAKSDTREYPQFYYVNFDRIAVWFKDFEGVEFLLKNYSDDMIQSAIEKILLKHGEVKL